MMAGSHDTEVGRKTYGQFQPSGADEMYMLYDGPEEWGLRITRDGVVTVGEGATIDGEYPNYVVSLPSGLRGYINASSQMVIAAPGFSMISAPVHLLADAVRDALNRPEGPASRQAVP